MFLSKLYQHGLKGIKTGQNEKMLLDPQPANESKQAEKVTQLQTRTISYGKKNDSKELKPKAQKAGQEVFRPRGTELKELYPRGLIFT